MSRDFTWSFSSFSDWNICKRRWQARYVYKQKEPDTPELLEGKRVHKIMEDRAHGKPLPPDMQHAEKFGQGIDYARQAKWQINTELRLGVTRTMEPTEFFAPNVWLRVVLDVLMFNPVTAIVIDWKTGKPKDNPLQLQIFAGATFIHHPELREVKSKFVWLKTGGTTSENFKMIDRYTRIWQPILPDVQNMEAEVAAERFPPTPGWACYGCVARDCENYKEKRR